MITYAVQYKFITLEPTVSIATIIELNYARLFAWIINFNYLSPKSHLFIFLHTFRFNSRFVASRLIGGPVNVPRQIVVWRVDSGSFHRCRRARYKWLTAAICNIIYMPAMPRRCSVDATSKESFRKSAIKSRDLASRATHCWHNGMCSQWQSGTSSSTWLNSIECWHETRAVPCQASWDHCCIHRM